MKNLSSKTTQHNSSTNSQCHKFKGLYANNFKYLTQLSLTLVEITEKCLLGEVRTYAVEDRVRLVPGTIWEFCPTKKRAYKENHHKVFNRENYLQWSTNNLLAQLTKLFIIILDNVKYHFALDTHVPKWSKMKKQKACLFLREKSISFDIKMPAVELKQFIPPILQWLTTYRASLGLCKGKVGWQYSVDTTLQMVYDRLNKVFKELENDHKAVLEMIDNGSNKAKQIHKAIS
jgi:hypothetical protein